MQDARLTRMTRDAMLIAIGNLIAASTLIQAQDSELSDKLEEIARSIIPLLPPAPEGNEESE